MSRSIKSVPRRSRIWGYVRLVHPFPTALVVVLSAILVIVAAGRVPAVDVLVRAVAVVLCSQIAVGSLNDWRDREADARMQPEKPIPAGLVPADRALLIAISALVVLVPLGLSFGPLSFGLAALGTSGGLAYDLWLKPTPASVIGYLVGFLSLITWVWAVAGHYNGWFILVYPAGTLVLLAGHLAQSAPDIESDAQLGQHGLAVVLGVSNTARVIATSLVIVGGGATALALLSRQWAPLILVLAALLTFVLAWNLTPGFDVDREARVRRFHLLAPGVAVLGVGCLWLIRSLS